MKDTYYFAHDYNARNDPKLIKLLMNIGIEGIGIYWSLVEMLYEQDGFLMLSECESYAFAMRTECEKVRAVIDSNLFKKDEEKFWSDSVLKRLEKRKMKSIKASESANSRWNNANAMRTQYDGNAIKESKVKKSKVKEKKGINIPYNDIINLFSSVTGKNAKLTNSRKRQIQSIVLDGYSLDDFRNVFSKMNARWKDDPKMADFITLETLLRPSHFQKYLEMEAPQPKKVDKGWT